MPDNKEPNIVLVTRDELKDVLRNNLVDPEMNNSINDDMKLVDMLNSRALSAGNAADAVMYMTIAAELAESIALRTELEVNSRMEKSLSSVSGFKNGETSCSAVSCNDKDNPGEKIYYAIVDENGEPIDGRSIFEETVNEVQTESANAISRLKQEKIEVYDKGAEDSSNAILARNDPESNKHEFAEYAPNYNTDLYEHNRSLTDADPDTMRRMAGDHCRNIHDIANAMLNGEPLPKNKSQYEDINTTMMYLTEKARLNVEVGMGGYELPAGVTGLGNKQMSVLKGKMESAAIYSGENKLEKETSASIQTSILNYYNKAIEGEKLPQIQLPKLSGIGKSGTVLNMVISCGRDENIDTNEFISKINSGKPLSEDERRWACRQFDVMAEDSGADIRGMLVNGEPVFSPEFNGKSGYEDKAKCVLIASALEGKRIAAVPLHNNGLPNTSFSPSPVTVLDTVETIKSLWEKILEFFGLGRSNSIERSNRLDSSKRISDAEKLNDVNSIPREMGLEILDKTKPDMEFEQKAEQLNEAAKREADRRNELMDKNFREFVSGMCPDIEITDGDQRQKAGFMIQDAVSYTFSQKENKSFLGTLARDGSLTHFMYLYGMTKGYTLDQMLFSDEVDRAAIGKEFIEEFSIKKLDEFAKDKQLDVSAEETNKLYSEYVLGKQKGVVKLSAEMYDTLKKQEFTAPDPSNPESVIANYVKQSTLFSMVGDFSQVFTGMNDNKLDPDNKSIQQENERATAMSNYEYFTLTSMQSYSTTYDKYIRYLTDYVNMGIPEDSEDRDKVDMAAYGKRFLEGAVDWTKGKKTVGDIISDEKLSREINSMASACAGGDGYYESGIMDELNQKYLRRTTKDMDYMRLDPEHFTISRLGLMTNNEQYILANEQDIKKSKTELAKFIPAGFENNLAESFSKAVEQETKAKAPVREKMGFDELLGGSTKRVSSMARSSEKQLENEKSKGSMGKS